MNTQIIITAFGLAHAAGMLLSCIWFYPIYFKREHRNSCTNMLQYLAMILFGWISLICLFIDINKNEDL